MIDLSGFRQFVEAEEATPTIVGTLGDELGIDPEAIAKFHHTGNPIILADVKLKDGTYHSLLPVNIASIDEKEGTAVVFIDDTFSPNLNDKVLRKTDKGMMKVPDWERKSKPMVIPLSQKVKNEKGEITTLQDMLSQGWGPAAQQAGGMGGPPMI